MLASRSMPRFDAFIQGRAQRGYKGINTPKLPKLDLTTDAEYVANLVNVSMWL